MCFFLCTPGYRGLVNGSKTTLCRVYPVIFHLEQCLHADSALDVAQNKEQGAPFSAFYKLQFCW